MPKRKLIRTKQESAALKQHIIALRRRGKSLSEIARHLGVSKQYVGKMFKEIDESPGVERKSLERMSEAILHVEQRYENSLAGSLRLIHQRRLTKATGHKSSKD